MLPRSYCSQRTRHGESLSNVYVYNKLVSLTTLRFVTWRQRRTFVSTEEMYIEIRTRERKKYDHFDTL